jgi:hypothetical protein
MWVAGGIEIKKLKRMEALDNKCPYVVLTLLSSRCRPPVRRMRRVEAAIRGTQVYKYSPHLAPGDEDQVEATS